MVDVTLQIVLYPKTHDLSYHSEKAAMRYRRGDIFEVHKSEDVATLIDGDWIIADLTPHFFGYIHVRNVPKARAKKMRDVLTADTGETKTVMQVDPETGLIAPELQQDAFRLKKYRIPASVIPAAAKTKLLADQQITVSWNAFRNAIRKKIISNRLDPSTDDESTAVTDEDLP